MKISLICFLLAFGVTPIAAHGQTVTGKWRVHTSLGNAEIDQTCMFAEDNGNLTGSCTNEEHGSVEITGKVDQMKVSWSYKSSNDDGDPISLRYDGRLDSGRITGTVTLPESGTQGDFSAVSANESGGTPE